MLYARFSEYLQRLEATSKRLEITDILYQLISELSPSETDKAIYLTLGTLDAGYKNPKFNVADKLMLRVLSHYNADVDQLYKTMGDLGDVTEQIIKNPINKNLDVSQIHKMLTEVAQISGNGSQDSKIEKLRNIIDKLDPLSAKYLVRIVLGTTRLGFTEVTIIDALVKYLKNEATTSLSDKEIKTEIEYRHNIRPEIGIVAQKIKYKGIEGINDIKMEPGVPITAQRCQRVSGIEEAIQRINPLWAEFKLDGTRVFLHMDRKNNIYKTFTRNLEETTHQFPDIIEAAKEQIDADSIILDGEALGYDPKTDKFLPFQETIQRKRKHGVDEITKTIPLKYHVFDILYKDGNELVSKSLVERKEALKKAVKPGQTIVNNEYQEITTLEDLQEFFQTSVDKGLEGVIVKSPNDPYQAGARSYSWIKLKYADEKLLDDTIDCVILGYYFGKGVRTQYGIGGFLAGIYDPKSDKILTVTKVGTGLKEDDWKYLKEHADKVAISNPPKNYEIAKKFIPDVYVKPEIVVELGADEITKSQDHSAGYALRFPRLIGFRKDKSLAEITTLKEVIDMFNNKR